MEGAGADTVLMRRRQQQQQLGCRGGSIAAMRAVHVPPCGVDLGNCLLW
eukprot:CAMPEP_0203889686 /NCGR_PEP_ID=MMETSP0359-20131031/33225_1 /ASSEMBLY_ACC=CAM_ASM_000338 /TAXON_ID=268821 /ORGANISM="Scrippsiella Hangoei, Strain SHTV-5" /LENGTH=48 /DNA_ID= /DNA_START= /DNA_END= /DNA_ORIENTATION=